MSFQLYWSSALSVQSCLSWLVSINLGGETLYIKAGDDPLIGVRLLRIGLKCQAGIDEEMLRWMSKLVGESSILQEVEEAPASLSASQRTHEPQQLRQ